MPKQDNWKETRVVVTVETRWRRREGIKDAAEEIVVEIKRHVDNVQDVEVEELFDSVCSFCEGSWTAYDPNYNGGCCEKDEEYGHP